LCEGGQCAQQQQGQAGRFHEWKIQKKTSFIIRSLIDKMESPVDQQ
jgi:hypothetical protein